MTAGSRAVANLPGTGLRLRRLGSRSILNSDKPETQALEPALGRVPVPEGTADVAGVVEPAPATDTPRDNVSRPPRVASHIRRKWALTVNAPFPDIA